VVLVFALHLLCVNVSTAGPLVCLWLEWREGRGDELAGRAGRYLAGLSLTLLVLGGVLGLLLGYLLWTPGLREALLRLPSKIYFGVWELVFSLVCMGLHLLWWRAAPSCSRWLRVGRSLLPLLAGTNLLYHFPVLFVVIAQIANSASPAGDVIDASAFRQRMLDGEVLARAAHFTLASFAVTGVALFGFALRIARRGADESDVNRVAAWGGRIALVTTLLQIPAGIWVLFQVPADVQSRLLGGDLLGAALLALSIVAALMLLHNLAAVAMGDAQRGVLIRSMTMMVLVVVLMTGTLQRSRSNTGANASVTPFHNAVGFSSETIQTQ
jgi:hypothetical protein